MIHLKGWMEAGYNEVAFQLREPIAKNLHASILDMWADAEYKFDLTLSLGGTGLEAAVAGNFEDGLDDDDVTPTFTYTGKHLIMDEGESFQKTVRGALGFAEVMASPYKHFAPAMRPQLQFDRAAGVFKLTVPRGVCLVFSSMAFLKTAGLTGSGTYGRVKINGTSYFTLKAVRGTIIVEGRPLEKKEMVDVDSMFAATENKNMTAGFLLLDTLRKSVQLQIASSLTADAVAAVLNEAMAELLDSIGAPHQQLELVKSAGHYKLKRWATGSNEIATASLSGELLPRLFDGGLATDEPGKRSRLVWPDQFVNHLTRKRPYRVKVSGAEAISDSKSVSGATETACYMNVGGHMTSLALDLSNCERFVLHFVDLEDAAVTFPLNLRVYLNLFVL